MTGRERILAAINGQKPDRMPWAPMVNDFSLSHLRENEQDVLAFLRKVKADIIIRWVKSCSGFGMEDDFSCEPSIKKTVINSGADTITTYETPVGKIDQVKTISPIAGNTPFITKYFITTDKDIPVYRYLWESMVPAPNYDKTKRELSIIEEEGVGLLWLPPSPLLQLIMYDIGLDGLNYVLADNSEEMESLLNVMAEKTIEAADIVFDSPGGFFLIPENSGTMLVTPIQFSDYCLPILKEYGRMARQRGKKVFLHACGHLQALLPLIAKANMHGIESLTEPPTGDSTLEYTREILGEEAVIFSGLNPVEFAMLPPKQIARRVEETIARVGDNPRFILMPSDSTPAAVPMENYEIVVKTLERYRNYI